MISKVPVSDFFLFCEKFTARAQNVELGCCCTVNTGKGMTAALSRKFMVWSKICPRKQRFSTRDLQLRPQAFRTLRISYALRRKSPVGWGPVSEEAKPPIDTSNPLFLISSFLPLRIECDSMFLGNYWSFGLVLSPLLICKSILKSPSFNYLGPFPKLIGNKKMFL